MQDRTFQHCDCCWLPDECARRGRCPGGQPIQATTQKPSLEWVRGFQAAREQAARLVADEGTCRHVDHVQGFCACQDKADAIRVMQPEATDV